MCRINCNIVNCESEEEREKYSRLTLDEIKLIQEKTYGKYFKYIFKTITTDNGSNFIRYDDIEKSKNGEKKRFEMYYTDPYSAWQKGINENCNGILRRFIPKGSKICKISEFELQIIVDKINNKPRKKLGFRKAEDLFKEKINNIIKMLA